MMAWPPLPELQTLYQTQLPVSGAQYPASCTLVHQSELSVYGTLEAVLEYSRLADRSGVHPEQVLLYLPFVGNLIEFQLQ